MQKHRPRPGEQTNKLLDLLKLECKYKLTEVSDVTFNELLVAAGPIRGDKVAGGRQRARRHQPSTAKSHRRSSPRALRALRAPPELIKSPDNQILQARPGELDLGSLRSHAATCGSSAGVQLDDPVMIWRHGPNSTSDEPDEVDEVQDDDDDEGLPLPARRPKQQHTGDRMAALEVPVGSTLAVECATLAELTVGRRTSTRADQSQEERGHFCGDWQARRKSLISGRYQLTAAAGEEPAANSNNNNNRSSFGANRPTNRQQLVAYVSLPARLLSAEGEDDNQHDGDGDGQIDAADSPKLDEDPQLQLQPQQTTREASRDELLAPPLLEWFVNHQEVSTRRWVSMDTSVCWCVSFGASD